MKKMNYKPPVLQIFFLSVIFLSAINAGASDASVIPEPKEVIGFAGSGLHLYPLGWSSEGRWGVLIGYSEEHPRLKNKIQLVIIDSVTDEILYKSDFFNWQGPQSFHMFWQQNKGLINRISGDYKLENSGKADVRAAHFSTGGYNYDFFTEPPSPVSGAYTLYIRSNRGDQKTVFKSSQSGTPQKTDLLGALISPFEKRALAVLIEYDKTGSASYRFSGAHLTQGFKYTSGTSGTGGASGSSSGKAKASVISAVFNGQEYLVKSRLAAGADPDEKDKRGYPALLVAARLGHWNIVADLLKAGADPDCADIDGRTPLHYAAFAGNEDAVRKLLNSGADKNIRDKAGLTPEDLAVQETLKALLR